MRIAVISDVHGNLVALEKVLDSIHETGVDRIVCLGDLVGYGARPQECVDLIVSTGISCIGGNHDEAAAHSGEVFKFNRAAKEAILWTRDQLSTGARRYLASLELELSFEDLLFVHSSPLNPHSWTYIYSRYEADITFSNFTEATCLSGHTHVPAEFREPGGMRRIINVGSVGQPRDRDCRSCWGLFDSRINKYSLMRIDYPVEISARQIIDAGLPKFLAERLFTGR